MGLRRMMMAGAAAGVYTALNPADKDSTITLSGGDLVADFGTNANWAGVRAVAGKSAGKWYFEVTVTAAGASASRGAGIAQSGHSLTAYPGAAASGWAHLSDGYKANNGYSFYGSTWESVGDILMVAVDIDAGKIWFGKNGTWMASGNPAAGTGAAFTNVAGTVYPILSATSASAVLTANFGGSFAYAPPSGFSEWTS